MADPKIRTDDALQAQLQDKLKMSTEFLAGEHTKEEWDNKINLAFLAQRDVIKNRPEHKDQSESIESATPGITIGNIDFDPVSTAAKAALEEVEAKHQQALNQDEANKKKKEEEENKKKLPTDKKIEPQIAGLNKELEEKKEALQKAKEAQEENNEKLSKKKLWPKKDTDYTNQNPIIAVLLWLLMGKTPLNKVLSPINGFKYTKELIKNIGSGEARREAWNKIKKDFQRQLGANPEVDQLANGLRKEIEAIERERAELEALKQGKFNPEVGMKPLSSEEIAKKEAELEERESKIVEQVNELANKVDPEGRLASELDAAIGQEIKSESASKSDEALINISSAPGSSL